MPLNLVNIALILTGYFIRKSVPFLSALMAFTAGGLALFLEILPGEATILDWFCMAMAVCLGFDYLRAMGRNREASA